MKNKFSIFCLLLMLFSLPSFFGCEKLLNPDGDPPDESAIKAEQKKKDRKKCNDIVDNITIKNSQYQNNPTTTNCNAYKSALQSLLNNSVICEEYAIYLANAREILGKLDCN